MAGPQFLWFLPLSHGKNAVALLVKKDSRLQLPPEHLLDVVHDFLSQEVILSYSCESYSAKRRPCGRPFVDASRCFTLTIWHSFWHIYPPFFYFITFVYLWGCSSMVSHFDTILRSYQYPVIPPMPPCVSSRSSWSPGLWPMTIFFALIFRSSFRSTPCPAGAAGGTELSWNICPRW